MGQCVAVATLPVLLLTHTPLSAATAAAQVVTNSTQFSRQTVIDEAIALARAPFHPPETIQPELAALSYDEYRQIRFQKNEAIWAASRTPFKIELFAPGFLYTDLIDTLIVENGVARPLTIAQDSFAVPNPELAQELMKAGEFAGFRIHYPLNSQQYSDEFIVFQGASYFRAVSKSQVYGLSARGLALNIGAPQGEEFPIFRKYWIERPSADAQAIVVHALLDSRSLTGAYRFGIYPNDPTWIEVAASLFPRRDLHNVGIAPLTSMYMFSPMDPGDSLDYRPAVHDSEGLAIVRSNQESIWRPLANPRKLQVSAFNDSNPTAFGLIQRSRNFDHFQDLEAKYERRPSAWVQPLENWGEGHVELVEIPSNSEANDNIVAYWRPAKVLSAGERFDYRYRLTWGTGVPGRNDDALIVRSAMGQKLQTTLAEIAIDYASPAQADFNALRVQASASAGSIVETVLTTNEQIGGGRLFLTFDPEGEELIEFRVQLMAEDTPVGETWLYRWTSR